MERINRKEPLKDYYQIKHNIYNCDKYVFPTSEPYIPIEQAKWPKSVRDVIKESEVLCKKYNIILLHGHIDQNRGFTYVICMAEKKKDVVGFYKELSVELEKHNDKTSFIEISKNGFASKSKENVEEAINLIEEELYGTTA